MKAVPPKGGAAFVALGRFSNRPVPEERGLCTIGARPLGPPTRNITMGYNKGRNSDSGGRKPKTSGGRGQQGGRDSQSGSPKGSGHGNSRKKQYSATTRDVERARYEDQKKRRRDLQGAAVNLPNWVIENLERVTPKDRIAPALEELGAASEALGDGNYQAAVRHGNRAKALSPSDATIRETIGIAAYRLGDWKTALTELRAYRRMAGETTHLPIEMDVLRAQGRNRDVEQAWKELQKRGGHGLVMNEGKVVYASFLLDEGRAPEAWKIIKPGRIEEDPNEGHLRLYFVAARTAAALGDSETARDLSNVIVTTDPSFPGWEQLESEIAKIS